MANLPKSRTTEDFVKHYIALKYPAHARELFNHRVVQLTAKGLPQDVDFFPAGYLEKIVDMVARKKGYA